MTASDDTDYCCANWTTWSDGIPQFNLDYPARRYWSKTTVQFRYLANDNNWYWVLNDDGSIAKSWAIWLWCPNRDRPVDRTNDPNNRNC